MSSLPAWLSRLLIRAYQKLISPLLPRACRFSPSCSVYAYACYGRFSWFKASYLTARRLLRCHPWHPGGEDPPPLS